ncbi:MAG: 4-alpha-glucanotransferase [Clostridia bacterium]|nr:4-alpha-glucanotransferase [Clostridia bacterium]
MKERFPEFDRSSGVLLNVSSLPGEYGIGMFSPDVVQFIDLINDMGFHWWQILPVTMIGWGNSPYSGLSTFAGNRLYICPQELMKKGLIYPEELNLFKYYGEPYSADYDFAKANSEKYLRLAFSRLTENLKEEIKEFENKNSSWLPDYALFMAIRKETGKNWRDWDEKLRKRDAAALKKKREELKEDVDFFMFEQYEFFTQWADIKEKAHARGVRIIGDLPFYVSTDSVDVWANQDIFQLDEDLNEKGVAGVPPDAFSATGQVWGNCLYDFKKQKKDNYSWWRKRISHCLELYDALRLDHFRAFYNYFSIPFGEETAANGIWEDGPREELLNLIKKDNPDAAFIAEDLGQIDEKCREFIDSLNIPTMRVFQFGFDGTPSCHIPYRYEHNHVAYTGTHDNNTTLGWLYELNEDARKYALKYCGFEGAGWGAGGPSCESTKAIIKTLMMSSANLVVLPFQDMLGYGSDTRMNIPGVAEGNWIYRLPYHLMATVDRDYFVQVNSVYNRFGHGIK